MTLPKCLRLATLVCLTTSCLVPSQSQTTPKIGKLVAGSKSVPIFGANGENVAVFQVDPGSHSGVDCSEADIVQATPLSVVKDSTTTVTALALPVAGAVPPFTLTLVQPLTAGEGICVSESNAAGARAWSAFTIVSDPNDYGRVRTYFIAGVQVSNQQSSSASSTAGQYVEAGFNYTFIRAGDSVDLRYSCVAGAVRPDSAPNAAPCKIHVAPVTKGEKGTVQDGFKSKAERGGRKTPGLQTNLDIRLSPIPVSAPATTTTTPATTPTMPTTTMTQNLLSSQQSARIVGSVYMPVRLTHWNNHYDYFTLAPLVRAGFANLLNPSVGSSTTGTSATQQTTSASFDTAYSFDSVGARLAWDRYPASTDKAPQTVTQFLVTLGRYSNLPSYVCKPYPAIAVANVPKEPTVTACNVGAFAPVVSPDGTLQSGYIPSRTYIPRIDVEGFAKLPNYPFVLGLDANLAQYTFPHKTNLDYLNKAGNDIRIYVGFQIDLNSLISKLGVNSQ